MEVILLLKINKLGNSGDIIRVKSGYARNYLIPTGKAILANKTNIDSFEAQRMVLEKENVNKFLVAQSRADKIRKIESITILSKVGKEGKIFGSVGIKHIIKEMSSLGIKVNKKEIRLPSKVLRYIGKYQIVFQPHQKVREYLNINILPKK